MTSLIGTSPNQVSLNGMLGSAAFKDSDVPFYGAVKSLQSAPTIASATTIAPTALVTFISGTTSIATITPPTNILTSGGMIILIPTGLWATTTAGNIAIVKTATVGESIVLTYDAVTTKWYPAVGSASALGSLTSAQLATALTDETGTGVNVFDTNPTFSAGITVTSDALISGLTVGKGLGSIATNTAIGSSALQVNTTGVQNTATGFQALYYNTTGNNNSATGVSALQNNTTGSYNSATGVNALYSNTTGTSNSATGYAALYSNTTGTNNSATGYNALYFNTTGTQNSATGVQTLQNNTTGIQNSATGYIALYSNTTGTQNSATGVNALKNNTTGTQNSATGFQALFDLATTTIAATAIVNATAYQIVTMGTTTAAQWIASGAASGTVGETFTANATAGVGTGTVATSANVAAQCNTNTALGANTGRGITTGSGNTILGSNVTGLAAGLTNNIILANGTGGIKAQHDGTDWTISGRLTGLSTPTTASDATTKSYVDALVTGLSWKNSVKAATTANITLSAPQTIDGISLIAGDRVLVKDQTTTSQNGIYLVAAGAWTRALDMDSTTPINEVNSAAVFVEQGTLNLDTGWTQINQVATLGTDAIAFTKFTGTTANLTGAITSSGTVTSLGSFTSAQLATALTDETGTGSVVFATAPTFPTTINVTGNAIVNNVIEGYTTTATAAAITTLTASSTYSQFFTGTTTQTVKMPDVTTLTLGQQFNIVNNSTGVVTVQSSGANTMTALAANTSVVVTCVAITGTTDTSWSEAITGASGGGGSVTISDDTTTAATYYPTFLTATSGTASAIKTSSTQLTYTPNTGTLYATIFNSSSDERLKDNIADLSNGLDIINQLSPKSFDWKASGLKSYGVIAQELELIVPALVSTSNVDGLKSVNYDGIIGFLISAVKELSAQVQELQK